MCDTTFYTLRDKIQQNESKHRYSAVQKSKTNMMPRSMDKPLTPDTGTIILQSLEETFSKKMADFENKLKTITPSTNETTLKTLQEEFYTFKDNIIDYVCKLKSSLENMSYQIDEIDNNARLNCLILYGITEINNENIWARALSELNKMEIPNFKLTEDMIDRCYRLGKNFNQSQKDTPKPILIKFTKYNVRNIIWTNKSKLKGTGIIVNEFLTPTRLQLIKNAKNVFGNKNVWTQEGRIIILYPDGKRKVIVTNIVQLERAIGLMKDIQEEEKNRGKQAETITVSKPQQGQGRVMRSTKNK